MALNALVVDDDADLTTLVGRFLANAGFAVEAATSGQEGLRKAFATRPDVILVDIMMPDLDGYEVCRRLRADPRTMRATIVALTARAQPVDKQMAIRAGADAHIVKPFNGKALVDEVKQLMAARSALPAPLGEQIAILHLKRGVGATTLAANLALGLAEARPRVAAAVDLAVDGGPRGGQLCHVLGLKAGSPWGELLRDGARRDELAEPLLSRLVRHSTGLFALPLPSDTAATMPGPDVIGHALGLLRSWCDYVVVDTPVSLGPLAAPVLSSSALVLLMITPDPAALRAARLGLSAIEKCAPQSPLVWPVLNGATPDWQSFRPVAEQVLGLPVAAVLPWASEECAQALAGQSPVILSRAASPLAGAVRELAQRVAALPVK